MCQFFFLFQIHHNNRQFLKIFSFLRISNWLSQWFRLQDLSLDPIRNQLKFEKNWSWLYFCHNLQFHEFLLTLLLKIPIYINFVGLNYSVTTFTPKEHPLIFLVIFKICIHVFFSSTQTLESIVLVFQQSQRFLFNYQLVTV